ncbi:exo-alpha-sialidase [candidate division WOR-3 bacterium]|nr:exo-alpha-sialidase [candidate division WOR-3 bacterium]
MKYLVLLGFFLAGAALADPPWSAAVKSADVGDTINEGESCIAFSGQNVYCVCNVAERGRVAVIPFGRSTDGGATWTTTWWRDPTGPDPWHSDPVLLTDDTGYVHLFVQFSTDLIRHYLSTDNGQTWCDSSDVSQPGAVVDKPWATSVGNTIHICWQQLSGSSGIYLARSSDAGRTWTRARIDSRTYITGICRNPAGDLFISLRTFDGDLHVFKSTDGGETWPVGLKKTIDTQCTYTSGWGDRAPMTCIAAPDNDHVIVTVVDQRHGNWDVLYSRSTDGGANWSTLSRLNDSTAGGQCKGWVEADVYGRVHALWYHTPAWPTSITSRWSVRYQYSDDGGATWSPSIRLNDTTFTSPVDFMGEYHIIETDSQYARCVWAGGREGDLDLWYAQAELTAIGIEENPFRPVRLPAVTITVPGLFHGAALPVEVALQQPASARLAVFDAAGRELRRLELGRLAAGSHRLVLEGLPRRQTLFIRLDATETVTARATLLD